MRPSDRLLSCSIRITKPGAKASKTSEAILGAIRSSVAPNRANERLRGFSRHLPVPQAEASAKGPLTLLDAALVELGEALQVAWLSDLTRQG